MANIPLDIDMNRVNGSYIYDSYSKTDMTKIKSVLTTCNVQCDKEGNLVFTADGVNWSYKYVGNGYFYSKERGYCRILDKGGKTYFSVLGFDYEKANASNQKMLIASITFLPIMLISIFILLISIIRNRKKQDIKLFVLKLALLAVSILVPLCYVFIGLVGLKSMSADTLICRKVLLPLMPVICYLLLMATIIAAALLGKSWIKDEYSLRSKLYYSVLTIGVLINLIFMYIMNGFKI